MAEANPTTVQIQQTAHQGVRASDFVGRTQGKLRDHYRIGKVLGTGKFRVRSYLGLVVLSTCCVYP